MTQPESSPPHQHGRQRWSWQRVLVVLFAIIGVGVLLYPTAAAWFSDRVHATEISGYVETVENLSPAAQENLLKAARQFNAELPSGPLRDPYTLNEDGGRSPVSADSETYRKLLDVGPGGMMARISIPSIHTDLPIFHDTDEATLAKGAGHLVGSSLPVGGTGSHSVITAHSGFVSAKLFDDLDRVAVGDTFTLSVLGETLYYKVDQILTVLPEKTDDLRKVDGKDYVTLVTCTPTGVNSHRLLVRGERVDGPAAGGGTALPSQSIDPGFPWWAVLLVLTSVGAVVATKPRSAAKRRRSLVTQVSDLYPK
ncbi:class C sortase [Paenarthrobacter ureafaciens]|uniref:class C sortase n=1 Tax=Paenarthrobacter ureafaciens TaxID=37931 RepID=UPI0014085D9C|nr:class C sortase [Paenarthrobacter ureafaciens]MCX8455238.1 class C sortase [Paenarthrobacter ureafaciens]MCY0975191.1 class C sortase [Paenarthrobacter ureafaciens]